MDGGLCLAGLWHLDKAEALRRAGLCVGDDRARLHSAERLEEVFEFFFGGLARHVPNDQFHALSVATVPSWVPCRIASGLAAAQSRCRMGLSSTKIV